jgi:hypothetical protein
MGEAAGSRLGLALDSEPNDTVPDVGEFRCAGRLGPGRREPVGCGGDPSGEGEQARRRFELGGRRIFSSRRWSESAKTWTCRCGK